MSDRPSTPPPRADPGTLPRGPITPEQVRRLEESRLRAKGLRAQHDAAAREGGTVPSTTPSGFAAGQKRPHNAISSSRTTPHSLRDASGNRPATAGGGIVAEPRDDGIRPAKKFDKYIEYDFSKMTDTKGGFLSATDDPYNKAMQAPSGDGQQRPAHMTMAEWERHQLLKRLRAAKAGPFEPAISALKDGDSRKCRECGSLDIDFKWDEVFGCRVCSRCKELVPDKYSLLTKTEAREDYLLTDPELKDEELLPHLERPNPHKSTWNNMQLYLRYQVEEYAFSPRKWGSAAALDAEFERRQVEARRRKEKKFDAKLAELKKKTMVEAYKRKRVMGAGGGGGGGNFGDRIAGRNDKHEHEWGRAVEDLETGMSKKACISCGMEVEEIEF